MKDRILQLANGEVDIPLADVVVYPASIDQTISSEYSKKMELLLQSKNGVPIKSLVYSTDHRVVLQENQAVGEKCSVHFEVMSVGMKSGSVISGAFEFVALGMEFQVPYRFVVEEKADDDILPMVDTLEHFTKIALENPERGLKLFLSHSFLRMPFMNDARAIATYEELALYGQGGARSMEEFLCFMGMKEPLHLSLEQDLWVWSKESLPAEHTEDETETEDALAGEICIKADGIGYVTADLKSSASFVKLAKNRIHSEDFTDGVARIPFTIDENRLYPGDNTATVRIQGAYETLEFQILMENPEGSLGKIPGRIQYKKQVLEAYRLFISLLEEAEVATLSFGMVRKAMKSEEEPNPLDGISPETAAKRAKLLELIEGIRDYRAEELGYTGLMLQLMHAYCYYINGRMEEFRLILDAAYEAVSAIRKKDVELYCIYLYLRYLMKPGDDQRETVSRLLKKYYVEQKNSLSILLMLLDVDHQLYDNDVLAYEMLREQYSLGSVSPLMYLAACRIINEKPEKLKSLDGFALNCVIFGARHHFLSVPVMEQVAGLALYERSFRPNIYSLLAEIYESSHSVKILTALVCVLIVGQKKHPAFFHWYETGILNDVRLTGIYENYLDSLPKDYGHAMPDQVLLFCADKDDLTVSQREVLYENVITYFTPDSRIYAEYKEQMEVFAIDQMIAGRYNPVLLRLYSLFLYPEMIDERIAQVLPAMLMVKDIHTDAPKAEWIVVRYPELAQEYRLHMKNGSICMPIYSQDAIVLFEDHNSIRYAFNYTASPLMENAAYLDLCREKNSRDLVLTVLDTAKLLDTHLDRPEQVYRLAVLLDMAEIHPYCKKCVISKLIEYCTDNLSALTKEEQGRMENFLLDLDVKELSADDRIRLVELYHILGHTKENYGILKTYGYSGVSPEVLIGIVKYAVLNADVYESFLLNICLQLYHENRYDAVILGYLLRYFNGITDEMLDLLDICIKEEKGTQMSDFPERLLGQLMFTGRRDHLQEVFRLYTDTVDANHLYMPLVQAYMSIVSYDYFMEDKAADDDVFRFIEQRLEENTLELSDICRIALLKSYAGRGILEKNRVTLAGELLADLFRKGYVFAFYGKLEKHDVVLPEALNGKVIIEYHSKDAEFVRMHSEITDVSVLEADALNPEAESYRADRMQMVYRGIFAETITLFDGEVLLCSFSEEVGRKTVKTSPVERIDTGKRYVVRDSRFDKINQAAANRQIDVEFEALLREISTADEMVKELFPLM